jgi:hypothetical protein
MMSSTLHRVNQRREHPKWMRLKSPTEDEVHRAEQQFDALIANLKPEMRGEGEVEQVGVGDKRSNTGENCCWLKKH